MIRCSWAAWGDEQKWQDESTKTFWLTRACWNELDCRVSASWVKRFADGVRLHWKMLQGVVVLKASTALLRRERMPEEIGVEQRVVCCWVDDVVVRGSLASCCRVEDAADEGLEARGTETTLQLVALWCEALGCAIWSGWVEPFGRSGTCCEMLL